MALRIQLSLVILMLGLAGRSWSAPLPTDGAKLVQALLLPETRLEAFRELYRRTESKRDRTSLNRFFNTEVIICPQATGAPIYIVLCDEADAPPLEDADSFGSKNLERLFPAKSLPAFSTAPPNERKRGKVVFAYQADGTKSAPFDSYDLLEGYLMDINQDGLVECIQSTNYQRKETRDDFQVLEIRQVAGEKARRIFRAVINDATDDWGWELRPGNGSFVLQLGPKKDVPETEKRSFLADSKYVLTSVAAEFRWNKATQRYEGPSGSPGKHFLVLDPAKNIWQELAEVEKQPRFAVLSSPESSPSLVTEETPTPPSPLPVAKGSWIYHSLAGKSDDELLRIMTKGKNASDVEIEKDYAVHVPEKFWDMPPKQAALALIQANRGAEAMQRLPLAIDDLDGIGPPKAGETGFEWLSGSGLTILKYRPGESVFSFSLVQVNPMGAGKAEVEAAVHKMKEIPISDELARQTYEVIWWLSRIRTRPDEAAANYPGPPISTADEPGIFWFSPGEPRRQVTLRPFLGIEWGKYDREIWANFALIVFNQFERKIGINSETPPTAVVGKPRPLSAVEKLLWETKPPDPSHIAETQGWIDRMVAVMRSNKDRIDYAIDALAPIKEASRYQDARIDQALEEFLATGASDPSPPKNPGDLKLENAAWAGRALARRGNMTVCSKLMQWLRRPSTPFLSGNGVALEGVELCARHDREMRAQLRMYLDDQLTNIQKSDLPAPELFDAVWFGKFVEFKPLLKQMATASEDEIESARISTTGPGANDHGRFHSARRILTVWEEEDALTRLKLAALLEATSYREIYVPDFLRSEFEALTPEQRKSFGMFVKWLAYQHNPPMNSLKVAKLDGAFGPQFQINH
jgi:hypothetical protein